MAMIEKSIDVEAPATTVYNQWTQFEDFPQFMEGVEKVIQLDDTHLRWIAEIGGVKREWDAEIVRQEPDQVIAWRSTSGAENAGQVSFQPTGQDSTQVTLRLDFEPEDAVDKVGAALGVVQKRAEGDLKRFEEFIEQRGTETGAWRGQV